MSILSSPASEYDVAQAYDFLESVVHMPEWVKQGARQSINAEMITAGRQQHSEKLRRLLNTPFGHRLEQ